MEVRRVQAGSGWRLSSPRLSNTSAASPQASYTRNNNVVAHQQHQEGGCRAGAGGAGRGGAGRGGEGAGLGWPRRAWSGACFGYSQTKRFISASPWLGGLGVIVMSNVRRGRRVYVWGQRACACVRVRVACVRAWSVCAWCDLRDVVTSSSGMGIPARCHFSGSSSVQWWGSVRRR